MVMATNLAGGGLVEAYGAYSPGQTIPISAMWPSSTAAKQGLSNQPADPQAEAHLYITRAFLSKLPFPYDLTSGYRAPKVNQAVGGAGGLCSSIPNTPLYSSRCSAHTSGLAADIVPTTMTNQQAAAWLYQNRRKFPNLDQVIWYHDTHHVHIGLVARGEGRAYNDAPGGFLSARKEGASYSAWKPAVVAGGIGLGVAALVGAGVLLWLWAR